jgi:UDP-N-acetylglucosamine 2-epimerase (non-hydrolysing)
LTKNHLACVVGARPNFMKMAPILRAMRQRPELQPTLIHTGQHYDAALSDIFFEQLEMQTPDVHLEVGSGSHAAQTAKVLLRMEEVLVAGPGKGAAFDRLIVVGDVNSTLAATLAATKLQIPVAHVEAGLRSGDRSMPEEINRLMTDAVADMLLVSEPAGAENLRSEGHADDSIHLVGNVMIDTLLHQVDSARGLDQLKQYGLEPGEFALVTLHRPSNVDHREVLSKLVEVLARLSDRMPVVFPVHPRTAAKLAEFGLSDVLEQANGIHKLSPMGYREFLCLTSQAKMIITDSGGLQEESTALGIPCLTMRSNTERPITVTEGTSTLIGHDVDFLNEQLGAVLGGTYKKGSCPELWDGKASERILDVLAAG